MQHIYKNKIGGCNDNLVAFLKSIISDGSTILDVGSGPGFYSKYLFGETCNITTVDAWSEVNPDILCDLATTSILTKTNKKYDYVFLIDFIEHVDKNRGLEIIEDCKKLCLNKIILLTPLVWSKNEENVNNESLWCFNNNYDLHKSLWEKKDFCDFTEININSLESCFVGVYERQIS